MNKKECNEIKKLFTPANCAISRICGCYVDSEKNKKTELKEAFLSLPEEEAFKYFTIFRNGLSGTVGKNLLNMEFPLHTESEGGTQNFLLKLRDSELKDEALIEEFYDKIIANFDYGENYYIILIHCAYDIPAKATDGSEMFDASDYVYEFIQCTICPVKLSKAGLCYNSMTNAIENRIRDWLVEAPEQGFLFPAFDDRATNLYGALYYTKNTDNSYEEFVSAVFNLQPPMPAGTQRETFREVLTDALEDECSVNVVQNVHTALRELVLTHKETRAEEPLAVTRQEVGAVLEHCGVSEPKMAAFNVKYDEAFGGGSEVPPQNLLGAAQLEYRTPDVVIRVNPDRQDLVQTRVLGGAKYLLINVDEGMELNGVSVRVPEEQKD